MTAVAISAGARMNSCAATSTRPRPKRSVSAASTPKRPCTPWPPTTTYMLPAGAACAAFTNAAASAWARASDWMRSPAGMLLATKHGHCASSSVTTCASPASMLTTWRNPARLARVRARAMAGLDVQAPTKRTRSRSGRSDAEALAVPTPPTASRPSSKRSSASSSKRSHASSSNAAQPSKPQRLRAKPGAMSQAMPAASTTSEPSPHAGSTSAAVLHDSSHCAMASAPADSAHSSGAS